jgi:hypothetical protein
MLLGPISEVTVYRVVSSPAYILARMFFSPEQQGHLMQRGHPGTTDKGKFTQIQDEVAGFGFIYLLSFIEQAFVIGAVKLAIQVQDGDGGILFCFRNGNVLF